MKTFSPEQLQIFQNRVSRFSPQDRLHSSEEAVQFVNERGFIFFWPVKGFPFPSLWGAVAGDRPVPDNHDDPGQISWSWKDNLLDKRVWYYGRILKKRNTIISQSTAPYFYALSPNYGSPVDDLMDQYQQGLLPLEAKLIFETLLEKGPLDSIALRREAHLSGPNSNTPFTRALDLLQRDFKVLPTAIADAGTWHYAFVYDLTHRYYPNLLDEAREISEKEARACLLEKFIATRGAATIKDVISLFGWTTQNTQRTIDALAQSGAVIITSLETNESEPVLCSPVFLDTIT